MKGILIGDWVDVIEAFYKEFVGADSDENNHEGENGNSNGANEDGGDPADGVEEGNLNNDTGHEDIDIESID